MKRNILVLVAALFLLNVPGIYNHVFTQPPRDSDAYDLHFAAWLGKLAFARQSDH